MTSHHNAVLGSMQLGSEEIILRYATPEDRDTLLGFGRSLPAEDLLFLRRDITKEEDVEAWMEDIRRGLNGTVLAVRGDDLVGYAAVSRSSLAWMRHVAELRVLVAPQLRGQGLGRALTVAALEIGSDMNVRKLVAQMPVGELPAMAVFRRLGFSGEALLPDHVIDANGETHDLIVMSRRLS